jgi:hypothetical protein
MRKPSKSAGELAVGIAQHDEDAAPVQKLDQLRDAPVIGLAEPACLVLDGIEHSAAKSPRVWRVQVHEVARPGPLVRFDKSESLCPRWSTPPGRD